MKISIETLIDSIPNLDTPVSIDEIIYRTQGRNEPIDRELFKRKLIRYMKKKVKKFEVDGDYITINQYIKADIPDLFKYFNLHFTEEELSKTSRAIRYIRLETLYQAWKKSDEREFKMFEMELQRYIHNYIGERHTFTYDGELFIRPYNTAN